jgi:glycosyltransferase involved in cell wall biosynthesis
MFLPTPYRRKTEGPPLTAAFGVEVINCEPEIKPRSGDDISVCLLTYNHAHIVESTIRSILDQSVRDFEFIISDDCSTDGTWEKIVELAVADPRIRAIRTPRNSGMPGNANFAVSHSQRPYIALLHHDDIYRSDLLEKWSGVLDRNCDVAFVFNPYQVYESDFIYEDAMPGERIGGRWLLNKFFFPRWGCLVRGTAMIRRSAWQAVGGMREQFNLLADIDLWMRLAMRWDAGYVSEPVISVRTQRPIDYPDTYKEQCWSWKRQRYLYEIHATNRLEYLNMRSLTGRLRWWRFRLRLNRETLKLLVYAVVREKPEMIASSSEGAIRYDLWPLRAFRTLLQRRYARS